MGIIRTMLTDGQRGLGANWVLSVAKIAAPEKVPVRVADIFELHGCVHPSSGTTYYPPIPKVILESVIIGEKKPRSTHAR